MSCRPFGRAISIGRSIDQGLYSLHAGAYSAERAARDPRNATRDAMLPCEPGQ
jgi:hypothetical protein